MANVPEYQRQVRDRPVNQQDIRVKTSDAAFGAGVGQAMQGAGETVFKVADAIDFKDQLTADADARAAYDQYRYAQREALSTPETGYLNRTGANGLGVERTAAEDLAKLRQTYGKGLNPRARKLYDNRVDDLQDQAHQRLLTHSSNETRNFIVNERKSTIDGYLEEAAANWSDESLFEHNLGLALAEQSQLAKLQGWDAETAARAGEQLVSKAMRQRVVLMADSDPLAAQELIENSRDVLTAEDERALDTGLKQLVIDAKVNKFIQPFIGTSGFNTGGGYDPYERKIRAAESGGAGRLAANNPDNPGFSSADGSKSSALGAHQFLRSTYVEQVRQMQAQGGAAWAAGMTDYEIAATRTDTAQEQEVFDFWRRGNRQALEANGLDATYVNEYALHHFGRAGGLALARMAMDKPAGDLLEVFGDRLPAILKANPQFKGKTAGEAYDWLAGYLGVDATAGGGAAYFNGGEALAAAVAIDDPELQTAALQKVQALIGVQNAAQAQSRQSAQQAAWDNYAATGNYNLGVEAQQQMGQAGWQAFRQAVRNDQIGYDVTDPSTWDELTHMAGSDRQTFAELNLVARYPSLSKEDRRHFVALQETVKAALAGGAASEEDARNSLNFGAAYKSAAQVYDAYVDTTPPAKRDGEANQRRIRFEHQIAEMVKDFWDQNKREPDDTEVRKMAMVLAMPTTITDPDAYVFGGTDGAFFDAANRPDGFTYEIKKDYEDIPTADRARIASQLMVANNGELPSPEEIADAYEQQQLISVGLPPNVDIDKVPEDMVAAARAAQPDITDEALVESYQLFLMEQ